jgi:GAF domain-containing protein
MPPRFGGVFFFRWPEPLVCRQVRLSQEQLKTTQMQAPGLPKNEQERIQVLHDLLILDTAPEQRFDAITSYARSRFQVEIALVSLVDTERLWFKSTCGLDAHEAPRDISFCGHAILQDDVMEIRNALLDMRFFDNPFVVGAPFLRFYAGAPLKLSSGHNVGSLCLIDSKPKHLDADELDHLKVLAHMVSMELERQGRIDNCKDHCLYGQLPAECPYVNTKHDLPDY